MAEADIKLRTARTLKWNTIDKFASQLLYAVTGVVLANLLSKEDFGLVGAMLVFQSFASLFVDSGFSSALIQKKTPTETDYCTVLWFNVGMSLAIYAILWFCSPLIASLFGDDRLVWLSRAMFLSFIINATAIVQTNRLMKQMTVQKIAISNTVGLVISGAVGIWLAVAGYGAWAIVWQTLILSFTKSAFLWMTSGWLPRRRFSFSSLKSVFAVGSGVMVSSFLNTVSLNIYSFIIGAYYNLAKLGCYTQADKWSKMGIMSFSQILTSSFLPVLSGFQDDKERLLGAMSKMNKFTAYLAFPIMLLLIMFQILCARGIFVILTSLYNNYILAIGRAKALVEYEVVKDVLMVAAIFVTIPMGVTAMIWGQFVASALFYVYSVVVTARLTGYRAVRIVADIVPYAVPSAVAVAAAWFAGYAFAGDWLNLSCQMVVCAVVYYAANRLRRQSVQQEVLAYAFGRFRRKKDC